MVVSSMLSFNALRVSCLLALAWTCACSSATPGAACGVVGRERSCACSGNAIGIQACQFDGQWTSCKCYPRNDSGGAGSGGIAANGGVGGVSASAGTNANAGRGGSVGQSTSGQGADAGGPANPWNPWDGFPGFAGFPWSR